jgi:hypothetical protein
MEGQKNKYCRKRGDVSLILDKGVNRAKGGWGEGQEPDDILRRDLISKIVEVSHIW